jgi:poly(hydroxyalkanoate) granule-associated protein
MSKSKTKPKPKAKAKPVLKAKAKPVLKAKPALKVKPVLKVKPELKAKLKSKPAAAPAPARDGKTAPAKTIMESAQQIWLAGVGAFAKAQGEGGKLFEGLVRQGSQLEQKTRHIAGKVEEVRGAVESGVTQVRERTQETWDKLEQVFESRVSNALAKLGVPGRKELDELLKRVDELNREVKKLNGTATAPKTGLSRVMSTTVRRARDDLSDLARELEEAQLAAKETAKRTIDKVKKTIRSATR